METQILTYSFNQPIRVLEVTMRDGNTHLYKHTRARALPNVLEVTMRDGN